MREKPILVVKPSMPPLEEYVEELRDVWESGILTHTGPKHKRLQEELEKYMDVRHVSLFANGHLALELGLKVLGLQGEVITTPFTFASTTQAVLRCGLTPVFCDIREDNYTIDCDRIEDLITDRTSAILPVHVYGNICDIEKIQKIADRHHLKVLYDAAHAFGETYRGVSTARLGDMSMFSFHATKVFHTVEGGCLTFADDETAERLKSLRQFGQVLGTDEYPYVGTNAKMTEVHAAMGLCNLRHVDEYIAKRAAVVRRYRERLGGREGIRLCGEQESVKSNYIYFPVVFEPEKLGIDRNRISEALKEHNIYAREYFYPLTSDFGCCRELGITADVPVAKYASDNVLTLPCYSDLACAEVDEICDIILELIDGAQAGGQR